VTILAALGMLALATACGALQPEQRPARLEVQVNLNSIRAAQIAYHAVHGSYVAVPSPTPRTEQQLDQEPVPWVQGSAFDTLGWAPDGAVYGAYWVEVTDGGDDFVAHILTDADGDGEPAHHTATRHQDSTAISAEGVR